MVSLDKSVYVVRGGQLGITSVADTLSFPEDNLRSSYAIHRSAWKENSPKFVPGVAGWHHTYGDKGRASAKRKRGRKGEPTCRSRRWRDGQPSRPSNAGTHWSKGSSEAPSGSWRS